MFSAITCPKADPEAKSMLYVKTQDALIISEKKTKQSSKKENTILDINATSAATAIHTSWRQKAPHYTENTSPNQRYLTSASIWLRKTGCEASNA